jgi:hypothetical protein
VLSFFCEIDVVGRGRVLRRGVFGGAGGRVTAISDGASFV